MNKIKIYRRLLSLGIDQGSPFPQEHEWLYNLINSYDRIDKSAVYKLFTDNTDYITIRQQFMIAVLTETEQYYDLKKFKDVHASIQDIISLWRRDPTGKEKVAWSAAWSAASAAWSAAWSAARSAAESVAESVAESAASAAEDRQVELLIRLIKLGSEKA